MVNCGADGMAETSLKGQLILDSGALHGSFFHRTVLLICQHDEEGAFGLVLNRSSGKKVGDALLAELPESIKEQELFLGGPVQPTALSYLHTDLFIPEANVLPNLNLGHAVENLVEVAESFSPSKQIKLFAGYAGWSPGQLEDELERNSWLTHPASLDVVFTPNTRDLWRDILVSKGGMYRLLAQAPEDLSWN